MVPNPLHSQSGVGVQDADLRDQQGAELVLLKLFVLLAEDILVKV